jgi:hypothetical protein
MKEPWLPNRAGFNTDPGGYSMSAWIRWAFLQEYAGLAVDPQKPPSSDDLKSPTLWLSHSVALTEAAVTLLRIEPTFEHMPPEMRGVCDTQYCAVALMLVGYSLEVCLKAMVLMRTGTEAYTGTEKEYQHHKLAQLANFIPDLSGQDKAILELLTHFSTWAGRYPDPGTKRNHLHDEVFQLSEQNRISAKDLFLLAAKVQGHVRELID